MEFIVSDRSILGQGGDIWPHGVLRRDNWDDFGFKTSFDLHLFLGPDERVNIGTVKILTKGQQGGPTTLPRLFEALPRDAVSLGQEHSYYEQLARLGPNIYRPVLSALNDLVFRPSLRSQFSKEPGYRTSLLRFSSAQSVFETATELVRPSQHTRPRRRIDFEVVTDVGGDDFDIDFEFGAVPALPGEISAVIGYNGTGKTQLLANLARIAAATGVEAVRPDGRPVGHIVHNSLKTFSAVIAISYSAFDTFALPTTSSDKSKRVSRTGSLFGYSYVGLRRVLPGHEGDRPNYELKSAVELLDDFALALRRAQSKVRIEALREAMTTLMSEASFARSGLTVEALDDVSDWTMLFRGLSTGHKIVLNIVVNLIAQLQPRTLVLIDEPEIHLHPPLIAALLSAIGAALRRYSSVAIVATHSPVVIQEIPARQVRVLRRYGKTTIAERLESESFAESVGQLTRNVFNLNSAVTDYQEVMRSLAEQYETGEIEDMFDRGLSLQGRALLASLTRDDGRDV